MTKKAPSKTEAKTDTKSKKNKEVLSLPVISEADISVLNRLYDVVQNRKGTDPSVSHSARLLSRGTYKIAQKFGEEAVECLIEAVARRKDLLIGESADVLYHLIVLWVDAGITPDQVWTELQRREGTSGIAEKAARSKTTKSVKE
ncbi:MULTISPECIES: phosphoribosyl-ATP diphosphatase [Acetobacter]|uniref:Phosphoribosyl-ATP pyrophosphatase n=1 Tax=Acetobacter pomorum DM001 TaxID=945681 RepID=F1YRV2_9PROT|nr:MULTISPECIES: phosphoribosyl-ATP diphosphatase [Acetobacter]ATI12317.1 phosphoribosyl-ATP diphosphatase [Acetobacter pomorum]AXC27544.1 phosphoribosyl-ATP diphosphatase [Acetobacter sp. JWB]EGE48542.1 Phosphoribosyl-ATP pyrophosphatase [Acetobacter pomorum DM001]KAA8423938.1 phosphoribosyl-ATP diphosphatase [Acetobacter pomorum]KAA8438359.1 phosphoribosyl-ATP diphosphatase [Acetobacter pomorum]